LSAYSWARATKGARVQQLDLLTIPQQPERTPKPLAEVTGKHIRAFVKGSLQDLPARQAERQKKRHKRLPGCTVALTEPQLFWLTILLESTLSAADASRATSSYGAILKKLRLQQGRPKPRTLFGMEPTEDPK